MFDTGFSVARKLSEKNGNRDPVRRSGVETVWETVSKG